MPTPHAPRPLALLPGLLALASLLVPLHGCKSTVPNVVGTSVQRDALLRWDRSMRAERRGSGLPRTEAEIPPQPPAVEPERMVVPVVVDDPKPYGLNLRDAELGQALLLVGEMAGINVVLDGDFSEPVRMTLPAVTLQAALETLVRTYACVLEAGEDDGIVVVHREDPLAVRSQVFVLHSTSAAEIQPQLASLVGETAVVVNTSRNVVMVTASAAKIRDVAAYLLAVDRPDRQVLIEARIIEVDRADLLELGSAIARNDISVDGWTADFVTNLLNPSPSVLASAGSDSGSLDVTLDMLHEIVNLQILQRPRLVALHSKQARLEILSEIPYVDATTTTDSATGGIGTQVVQEVQFKNVGLELAITPTIQADGLVSLVVEQRVSVQTGTFNTIPIVDSRTINTSFVVREGDTIMIGGIMKNSAYDSKTGVPLLMDIPWLGQLFQQDVRQGQSQELVILMTPRLVDPRSLSAEDVSEHVTVELEDLS